MYEDNELVAEFVIESNEHLANVESQLLAIESGGESVDVDLVNTVFRAIHSIKGAAGFLGLRNINDLSHSLENVLNKLRNLELTPNSAMIDVLLRASDQLRSMINDVDTSDTIKIAEFVQQLDQIAAGVTPSVPAAPAVAEVAEPAAPAAAVEEPQVVAAETPAPVVEAPAPVEPAAPAPVKAAKAPAEESRSEGSTSVEANIRVPVSVLDRLMNLTGELVLCRNQVIQAISSKQDSGLEAVASGLDQVTSELQDAVMQTRMQPIGQVFNRFIRVVRDLGAKLGKECNLQIDGKEVEVDKSIIEAIGDPMTHLIRNSMDHGLETPQKRVAAGKSPAGRVNLRAYHQAGKVRIDIEDDGQGINPAILKEKAVSKGIITQDQAEQMSDRDAVRLIFHAGFSTAEKLTDVSGRGVGMDVVRSNIEKLGGTVDVESTIGKGTNIQITLPLTLAIIPSLIVETCGNRFAIPQANISELVRVRAGDEQRLTRVKGAEMLRLRGSLLPIVRMNGILNLSSEQSEAPTNSSIIVVETGRARYGLAVDGLHDSEEIVVKPLGRHLRGCKCLSGATILGDGHIALILDVAGISDEAKLDLTDQSELEAKRIEEDLHDGEESQTLLMFTNHPQETFAIPMGVVLRVERIKASQIDTVGGLEVLQYRGASLPVMRLENNINARPAPADLESVFVVIFDINGYEVGLIAPQLKDIQSVVMHVDSTTFRETGVCGSFVFDGHAIRLLDVFKIVEKHRPEWFEHHKVAAEARSHDPIVLLAEDSDFFRRQVKGFLEEAGFQVVDAEDGQAAWETLQRGEFHFDLIVTDIEMPRMNGFELSRQVRSSDRWKQMPIVALTSLASDEHRREGEAAGIDDYQIKMDRERLLSSVSRLTQTDVETLRRQAMREGSVRELSTAGA
ncbi:chemotaxis protein CheW [Blastopirellula marina]|uniref:histidine kinase n=1 Tax=Blastopirellula marina TaxID=124 RepID=A0A2S8FTQ2_9BACT|nr:chemotaxis protein CheW [Blastopirellula marina]PQO35559.1 hybrid sensor histidine kinase/response regulator [Blastopirellula marina]PTL44198.1 hybrid sensor histidine kinase/response regulator [Blastopirellula marina]